MENYRDKISVIPILQAIDSVGMDLSLARGEIFTKAYSADEILHFDGDECKYMEIILNGEVDVERIDEKGNLMTVATFSMGDCLGANLIFSSNPYYPMTVSAKSDVVMMCLTGDKVFDLCKGNGDFLQIFMRVISDHTIVLGAKIKHYVNRTIRESVTAYLLHETHRQKSQTIRLTSSKKVLAERMGIQRTSLSRELQKMKKEGMIEFDAETITLL